MAMVEEFQQQGDWLFRRRGWLPLILIIPAFFLMRDFSYPFGLSGPAWLGICFFPVLIGLFIRSYSVGHAPIGTSGRNTTEGQIAICVNKTGFYSVVRHPLYLGNFFMWLGVALYPANWVYLLIFILVFFLYYERIMFAEEAFLRKKFGEEYERWADQVPAFLPKWSQWQSPDHPTQWKVILRQEYIGLCVSILLLSLLAYAGKYSINGYFEWTPFINVFLGAGVGLFIVIRALAKLTHVLNS